MEMMKKRNLKELLTIVANTLRRNTQYVEPNL